MAKHSKSRGKLGSKGRDSALADKRTDAVDDEPKDPLRAYPANPPRRNVALLVIAAALFAIWFCVLAYIAISNS